MIGVRQEHQRNVLLESTDKNSKIKSPAATKLYTRRHDSH